MPNSFEVVFETGLAAEGDYRRAEKRRIAAVAATAVLEAKLTKGSTAR